MHGCSSEYKACGLPCTAKGQCTAHFLGSPCNAQSWDCPCPALAQQTRHDCLTPAVRAVLCHAVFLVPSPPCGVWQEPSPNPVTIFIAVDFPWQEAISTKLTVPSPAGLVYGVNWPDSEGSLTNYHAYSANVTRIKSPVAFKGCAVDLMLDAMLGQPAHYDMCVAADSFVNDLRMT